MDILDEVDAAVREKRSKWKYTPMREKSETDAIIDDCCVSFLLTADRIRLIAI